MKSPASKVGIMEPDGILNGSTINERITKTTRITGKKLLEYSTQIGSALPTATRFLRKNRLSASQIRPVTASTTSMNNANIICLLPLIWPKMPLVESLHYLLASCAFCLLFAFPAIFSYVKYRHRNILPRHSYAWLSQFHAK